MARKQLGAAPSNTVDAATKAYVDSAVAAMQLPVGSIYVNRTVSTNPATLLGYGTWTAIQDKMIMGRGSTYTADGGAATHTHGLSAGYAKVTIAVSGPVSVRRLSVSSYNNTHLLGSTGTGTGAGSVSTGTELGGTTDAGDNIPPMIVGYMWERTA